MSILAVYSADDLFCPRRVLTHEQDIRAELSANGITLLADGAPAAVGVQQRHERRGAPAYEQPDERIDAAEVFACGALERRIEQGHVRLCLASEGWVLLLALGAGDRLILPAGLQQCILPTPGQTGCWVDTADNENALIYAPVAVSTLVNLAPLEI
ncbi:hypothetical protein [Halopseudomonas maritima]|uniref:hypothetical protein n=1 Tax=Halopseudomonas maritima TaxID=2918528 RepID=UPI001EEB829E|nr:hypothetical protein [Halopseudomonas maritima]UJJ31939.1 hypothetical protein HV822_01820 [Halopseudomonas maritima]